MGTYITKSDIEAVFGVDNMATWSDLENTQGSTNEDRVDTAIAHAESLVDDRFRHSRYAVPLQGIDGSVPAVVVDWAAKLAGIWLYESRGLRDGDQDNQLAGIKSAVETGMDAYLSGKRRLNAVTSEGDAPGGPVVVE